MVTQTGNPNSTRPLIDSLLPRSAFKDEILGNGFTTDQTGLLLLFYLVSNSFPAESQSGKVYQLLKTQGSLSPSVFQALKGPSVDSVIENLFKLAIEAEDLPMVKNLIKAGANVNANNCKLWDFPIPWTPLQFACLKGNTQLVQELITAGSEIDAPQSGWKFSAILLAIHGHEHFVRWNGRRYPLGPKPVDNESLVHLVQLLFDEGASVNAVDTGTSYTTKSLRDWKNTLVPLDLMYEIIAAQHSPLTLACKFRYKKIVHFLILKGADVQFRMDGKSSTLRLSLYWIDLSFEGKPQTLTDRLHRSYESQPEPEVRSNIVSIARRLMRAGADLNDHAPCDLARVCKHYCLECYSVLDLAVLIESKELIDLMLHAGSKTTRHSLDLAIQVENFEIFGMLLDEGVAIPDWAFSKMQDEISPFLRNEDSRNAEDIYLQRVRALVLAAIRLGAISELDRLIKSMNGSATNLLNGCTGLTTAIEHCCGNGHSETLQYLLEASILPKSPPAAVFGVSVLLSMRNDRKLVLDLLLENRADVNAGAYEFGKFKVPVLVAIENGDVELVRKLIRAGAELEDKQSCPHSCDNHTRPGNMLVAAIEAGNLAVTEEILGEPVDINGTGASSFWPITDRCCTPIVMAIMKRNWTLVDRLRCGGANVYSTGQNLEFVPYYTPLWAAAYQKHFKLAKSFIEAGAEVNDRMALEAAVHDNELLELFLAKIANSKASRRKCDALHFALQESIRHNSILKVELILKSIQMLLEADVMSNAGLHSELHYSPAQLAAKKSGPEVLQMLLTYGFDPNAVAPKGQSQNKQSVGSAIQYATEKKNVEMIRILLAHSANPNATTKTNPHTALQIASRDGNIGIAELLLKSGADVNSPPAENFGATALQFAALGGYLGVTSLLIDMGADINALPAKIDGRTALEGAAEHGRIDMVQLLKSSGAEISGDEDGQYKRALTRAFENGHHATWRLLQSYFSS
jgi:ankyrin repeat protein